MINDVEGLCTVCKLLIQYQCRLKRHQGRYILLESLLSHASNKLVKTASRRPKISTHAVHKLS